MPNQRNLRTDFYKEMKKYKHDIFYLMLLYFPFPCIIRFHYESWISSDITFFSISELSYIRSFCNLSATSKQEILRLIGQLHLRAFAGSPTEGSQLRRLVIIHQFAATRPSIFEILLAPDAYNSRQC